MYGESVQDFFVLCKDIIGKGINEIMCRANPMATLLLDDRKLLICIILVNRVPTFAVHKMSGVRDDAKGNLMSRAVYMGRLGCADRYIRPDQKFIQPHIARITGLVKNSFFAIIIDFYSLFSGGLFWIILIRSTGVDVVHAHDLYKGFHLFHVGIVVAYMGMCTILTDEGLQLMTPLSLCYHSIYIP